MFSRNAGPTRSRAARRNWDRSGTNVPAAESDSESPSSTAEAGATDDEQVFSDASSNGPGSAISDVPETQGKPDTAIAENPFDSEANRILFDAIDRIKSDGAGSEIGPPQLVVVGGQSAGKSSLLHTLTEFPFPIGTEVCTRFATRIVSRRTAAGTANEVKITIEPADFKTEKLRAEPVESYRGYIRAMETLTTTEFSSIIEEVTTKYMKIRPGSSGLDRKNFAAEVLKVEISGPTRSHFSILDIPGHVSTAFQIKPDEVLAVEELVTGYMKQSANIVICIMDATADLSQQPIFRLAKKYVDKTRTIGVFTKCDLLKQANSIVSKVNGQLEDLDHFGYHGSFVVRNRAYGDDADPDFDLARVESELFGRAPWTEIREDRRGSARLKEFLGRLLCDKIKATFPDLLAELRIRLGEKEAEKARLGKARDTQALRRSYLGDIAQKYEANAEEALRRPWHMSDDARIRSIVNNLNMEFDKKMEAEGHEFQFEDHGFSEKEYVQRLGLVITNNREPEIPGNASLEIFNEIREEVEICGSAVLPGLVNPEIIHRLYRKQTRKWKQMAEEHMRAVADVVSVGTRKLLGVVCPSEGATALLHKELRQIITTFHERTLAKALTNLNTYSEAEQTKMPHTTDPGFGRKLRLLQSLRVTNNFVRVHEDYESGLKRVIDEMQEVVKNGQFFQARASLTAAETVSSAMFEEFHSSSHNNTVHDVHDILKIYYEFSLRAYVRHITHTIVEDFLLDPYGPLNCLTRKYIELLPDSDIDRLGQESQELEDTRSRVEFRIQILKNAEKTAREALARASRVR